MARRVRREGNIQPSTYTANVVIVAAVLEAGIVCAGQRESRCSGLEPFVTDSVVSLCAEHFIDGAMPDRAHWVVHFYGQNCRHCREIAAEVSAAAQLAQVSTLIRYGAVDCHHASNKQLCKDHRVWKLPVLRALGRGLTYSGTYKRRAMHEWATSMVLVASATPAASARGVRPLCPAYEIYDEPRIAREFLRAHNIYRCTAGLHLLTWDVKAFATARHWAERAPTERLEHSPEHQRRSPSGSSYGENVAVGEWLQPGRVVARWHGEIRGTPGGRGGMSPPMRGGLGHYTQLMWRKTRRVGCSMAQGRRVVVCHYDPGGNERGKHMTQVAAPLDGYGGLDGELRCGGFVEEITV
eukprot:TRINITY_DN73563_c0_g1_i1.p1 TRINITY_DN73563_c0_g1~~TRINITY_DN73563_c0_g1_i1.p1  ORF type:complete len:353 (+),score=37.00 TRINITY_DN73563_c0_g1_i1:165-1223(+)